ncbi:MAG: helix-turn-helix domain-containing protein [Sphingobium sp.]
MIDPRPLYGAVRKYGMERTAKPKPEPRFKPPYIRAWRELKGYSLEHVAHNVPMDKGNLSKVERGLLPYNQEMLERIAVIIGTSASNLIGRDPNKEGKVIDLVQRLNSAQLEQAERVLAAMFQSDGTNG